MPVEITTISNQISDINGKKPSETLIITAKNKWLVYEQCFGSNLSKEQASQLDILLKEASDIIISYYVFSLNTNSIYILNKTKFLFNENYQFKLG